MTRRTISLFILAMLAAANISLVQAENRPGPESGPGLKASSPDEKFLDKLQYDSIQYFLHESNPANGLIKDSSRPGSPCSVAAVGFGIASICIGHSRGWIAEKPAYDTILRILKTFEKTVPNERGFFYRFIDMKTGKRAWDSEASSLDTASFMAGALFAGEYFKGTEVENLARQLYERVEWPWMLNGKKTLCAGWKPEEGFLWRYWDSYGESMVLYALAIGSPTHPIPSECWFQWKRPVDSYKGYKVIYCATGSISEYQYSHAWIDFRQLYEDDINYFNNSVNAVKANREFCMDNSGFYKAYGKDSWGLGACLGPDGYRNYGAKPGRAFNDGTIPPYGMAGSLVFDPVASLEGLKRLYVKHRGSLYGKYGFKDAFNPNKNWWAEEYLGVDVGITVLMIENYRTGLIWNRFMSIPAIKNWASKSFYIPRSKSRIASKNSPFLFDNMRTI